MRYTLEFDADNPEEVSRVLATVTQLAEDLEQTAVTGADSEVATDLPPTLLNHIRFRVTTARQQTVREICSTELADRGAIFKPAPNSGATSLFLPDVPDASYARVHPSRGVLRLSQDYATHKLSRAMTSERTAYGVAVDTTMPEGVAEFHRLSAIAAEMTRKEFGR